MKITKQRILEIIKEECGDMGMIDYGPHHDQYFDYTDDEGGMAKPGEIADYIEDMARYVRVLF